MAYKSKMYKQGPVRQKNKQQWKTELSKIFGESYAPYKPTVN